MDPLRCPRDGAAPASGIARAVVLPLAAALCLSAGAGCAPGPEETSPTSGSDAGGSPAAGGGPAFHVDGLGSVHFPSSGAEEARPLFLRGLLLLHSFEYGDARAAFDSARALDPDYAMAYWGEAMTHNHPLWREQDRAAARAALRELAPTRQERLEAAPTERERGYLEAVEILYGEDGSKARRDTLYSRAMARLADRFPEDVEAKAFHALSLLGLSGGDRHVPTYMEAGAEALRLFREHPDHPGAAHYAIHSFDDPTHAPLGLDAARAYAEIAPRAAHAQHMTSHIFLALGRWSDVVAANEAAARTTAADRGYDGELYPCGHYAEWLAYGYLQQGRAGAAGTLILACHALVADEAETGSSGSVARMRAHYLVDAEAPEDRIARLELDPDSMAPVWRLARDFGDGMAALGRGEIGRALASADRIRERASGEREGLVEGARVLALVLRAMAVRGAGQLERALGLVRDAAAAEEARPVPFGPPPGYKPPRELEGEILLDLDRPSESVAAFRRSLERTPRRRRSLEGLARAAGAAGEAGLADRARERLKEIGNAGRDGDTSTDEN